MRLILVISSRSDKVNYLKLAVAENHLTKKDIILVSGNAKRCAEARIVLGDLGVKQSQVLLDVKSKGTKKFVKEYMNDYKNLLLISNGYSEDRLIKHMYGGKLEIVRI